MAVLLIGEVAERAGVSAPTIRYYEEIGLLPPPPRSSAGYRRYTESAVEELLFVRKAQALGFSLDEIRNILQLARSGKTPCSQVLSIAHQHLAAVKERIAQLERFRDHLAAELAKWNGTTRPTGRGLCEIIASAAARTDAVAANVTPRPARRRKGASRTHSGVHHRYE